MAVIKITKDNFLDEVVGSMKPVIVEFYTDWCQESKKLDPVIDEIDNEYGDKIKVCRCNVDESITVAMNYQIINTPTLIFMKEGLFKERMAGYQEKETITKYLDSILD